MRLPRVRVVQGLVIRRQFYRAFSVVKALRFLFRSLTRLEHFTYETWRGINTKNYSGKTLRDQDNYFLFLDLFELRRRSLQMVSIYEDAHAMFREHILRKRSPALGRALAKSSRNFDELHASHNVDAKDFFHDFWPGKNPTAFDKKIEWKNLEILTMTSYSLTPSDYDELIRAAAAAAQKMPRLVIMELWNGGRGYACIFRYVRSRLERRARVQLLIDWPDRSLK